MAQSWMRNLNLLSCRRYAELASKRLECCRESELPKEQGGLRGFEAFFYWFHHLICMVCRRYNRQISMIDTAARCSLSEHLGTDSHGPALSLEAKARLEATLRGGGSGTENGDTKTES